MSGIGQMGKAGPRDKACFGQELFDHAAHGGSTEQHGFIPAPAMQNPVGENMAAFQVCRDLDFVDGEEGDIHFSWHGFHGADPIAGIWRDDLFFARDQCHPARTHAADHAVIDLAREQAQGQADHARAMGQHPLDRQMRLAGVGRPKHGRDVALHSHPHRLSPQGACDQ